MSTSEAGRGKFLVVHETGAPDLRWAPKINHQSGYRHLFSLVGSLPVRAETDIGRGGEAALFLNQALKLTRNFGRKAVQKAYL